MLHREVKIPGFLAELHGEKSRLGSILLVYLTGITAAGIFTSRLLMMQLEAWKVVLAGLVMLDISGGVVANLSSSTNQYYQGKPRLRKIFLLLHFFQPLALFFVFPAEGLYLAYVFVYTITASLIVDSIRDPESQQNAAAALVVLGVLGSLMVSPGSLVLYSIAPLFMMKLILGFSVRRPVFGE